MTGPSRLRALWAAVAAVVMAVLAVSAQAERQQEIEQRGAQVMPFDLHKTTHVFDDTVQGGVQRVTANDPNDTQQIELIRSHLRHERAAFARGDFGDPGAIHGNDMPGLAALRAGAARINVAYAQLPAGAMLTYASDDPPLVRALHDWFAAQRADHAAHGHAMHHHAQ